MWCPTTNIVGTTGHWQHSHSAGSQHQYVQCAVGCALPALPPMLLQVDLGLPSESDIKIQTPRSKGPRKQQDGRKKPKNSGGESRSASPSATDYAIFLRELMRTITQEPVYIGGLRVVGMRKALFLNVRISAGLSTLSAAKVFQGAMQSGMVFWVKRHSEAYTPRAGVLADRTGGSNLLGALQHIVRSRHDRQISDLFAGAATDTAAVHMDAKGETLGTSRSGMPPTAATDYATHAHTHTHTRTHTYTCTHTYTHTHTNTHPHTNTRTHSYARTRTHTCTCTHIDTHIHNHTYTHTHIHFHIRILPHPHHHQYNNNNHRHIHIPTHTPTTPTPLLPRRFYAEGRHRSAAD